MHIELKRVTYRISKELVETLKRAARRKKISASEYVEHAIRERIERDERQCPARP